MSSRPASNRLNSHARRDMIVSAAVPLFARKGFAGTTTREIAEAAGVSEGLLFKYFANKTALYDAIVHQFHGRHPTFEGIRGLPPSTQSLAHLIRVTTEHLVTFATGSDMTRARYRMFLRSMCEDGAFAQLGVEAYAGEIRPQFEQCFEAARRAGDLIDDAPDATTAFWIMGQQQMMVMGWSMPSEQVLPVVPIEESIRAILRSIGVTENAMRRLAQTETSPRNVRESAARIAS